jgi:hypothetical protein
MHGYRYENHRPCRYHAWHSSPHPFIHCPSTGDQLHGHPPKPTLTVMPLVFVTIISRSSPLNYSFNPTSPCRSRSARPSSSPAGTRSRGWDMGCIKPADKSAKTASKRPFARVIDTVRNPFTLTLRQLTLSGQCPSVPQRGSCVTVTLPLFPPAQSQWYAQASRRPRSLGRTSFLPQSTWRLTARTPPRRCTSTSCPPAPSSAATHRGLPAGTSTCSSFTRRLVVPKGGRTRGLRWRRRRRKVG